MDQILENILRQAASLPGAGRGNSSSQLAEALSSDDELRQIQAAEALCMELNMATSLTLTMMNTSAIVPALLGCLRKEHNPELQLLAARALTYMSDSLPHTLDILSNGTNVQALLNPVAAIQDVELAEQCLACIERLCHVMPGAQATFRCNGISTMLGFVDFFTTGTQRKIWASISRMCKCVEIASFDNVRDVLPAMRASLHNEDAKVRIAAISALVRVLCGVRKDPRMVDEVFNELPDTLISIVTRSDGEQDTFTTALTLVLGAVSFSDVAARLVIESGLLTALLHLLDGTVSTVAAGGEVDGAGAIMGALVDTPADPNSPLDLGNESIPNADAAVAPHPSGRRQLSFEESKTLCNIFSTMLVRCRDGPLAYIEELAQLELKEPVMTPLTELVDARSASGRAGGDSEEEEEGEDEDNVKDYDEEEEEEESSRISLEQLRAALYELPFLKINNNSAYARIPNGRHVCDSCGKACVWGDWYRCNDCADCDYCTRCLIGDAHEHADGSHSFTDMNAVHQPPTAKPRALKDIEKVELELYSRRPDLLVSVLRAVPKVVVLSTQSEAAVIRASSMRFLLSAATMASTELLQAAGMSGPAVCEAAIGAITDSSLLLNLMGVALVTRLLEKLPADYAALLIREGVASALSQLRQKYPSPVAAATTTTSTGGAASLSTRVMSLDGWRGILGEEVAAVFSRFPALNNASHSEALDSLVTLLQQDKIQEAGATLRAVLAAGTTAYEFASQNVFHELRQCLLRCGDDVEAILHVAIALCKTDKNTTSGEPLRSTSTPQQLGEMIHLLHTGLSHLDNFTTLNFGTVCGIHQSIALELMPHRPTLSSFSSYPSSTAASQPSPPAGKKRKGGRRTSGSAGSESNKNRCGQHDKSEEANAQDDKGNGPTTRVNIEPLANVQAICSFIAQHLVRQASNPRAMLPARGSGGDNDDNRVVDVLPELGENNGTGTGSHPGSSKRSKVEEPPSVWLRYENHVLPLSMNTIQILQTLVAPSRAGASKTNSGKSKLSHPIRLHYSTKPFGPEYKMASLFRQVPGELEEGVSVVVPSHDARPDAVTRVLAQARQPFHYSRAYLNDAQIDILTLLGVFYEIVSNWSELLQFVHRSRAVTEEDEAVWSPPVTRADFVHQKLNNKAMRHCSNLLLAGQHTSIWAVNLALDCNFLFPPTTRKFMFEVAFCGTPRSLARMQQNLAKYGVRDNSSADHNSSRNVQIMRQKKRVWRQHALECAMNLLGGPRVSAVAAWEFEFYGEAGSGLGPTREFYTLVSKALRERARNFWRSTNELATDTYFTPLNGLYPRPLAASPPETERESLKNYFKFIGRFLGRALLDEHVASLPLSPVLLKLFRGDTCGVHDTRPISESLCDVLLAMTAAVAAGTDVVQLPGQKKGYPVDCMCLQFILPGDDGVELVPGGAEKNVTKANMADYCDAVTNHMLNVGVSDAVVALREGFNDYIPLMALRMLSVEELFEVVNGHTNPITRQEFEENCCADHGFTSTCSHVQWLYDILASYDLDEQKRFFLFLTGSPHLPVGGLASLRPKLTVVRKTSSEPAIKEPDQLPSAMTCQHYLKLPAYESKAQMEEKLRQAINEGTGAFLLS